MSRLTGKAAIVTGAKIVIDGGLEGRFNRFKLDAEDPPIADPFDESPDPSIGPDWGKPTDA
jgi:hypothetical protein